MLSDLTDLGNELKNILRCPVEANKSLGHLTTLGVGGRAKFYAAPDDIQDFQEIFKLKNKLNFDVYIIGGGSNIIFPDGEISGLVLSTKRYNKIKFNNFDSVVTAQAGCGLAQVVSEAEKKCLSGLEFAVGIPGTLGGAVFGNAGAGGHGVAELVAEIKILEANGDLKNLTRDDFLYSYRNFELKNKDKNENKFLMLEFKLKLNKSSREFINSETEKFLNMRINQPPGRSAGCTFKNPVIPAESNFSGYSAGKLLDLCGCKGLKSGGAVVSECHANFILNNNNASSEDVINLINICKERVLEQTGIVLEPEIKFMVYNKMI